MTTATQDVFVSTPPTLGYATTVQPVAVERRPIRIHRSERHLILQHHLAHDKVGIDRNRCATARNPREDKNPVQPKHLQHIE